jgi:type VI secretion system protein ImpL
MPWLTTLLRRTGFPEMNRFWTLLFDTRVLGVIGIAGLAAFLFFGANALELGLVYAAVAFAIFLAVWGLVWCVKRWLSYRAARALERALDDDAGKVVPATGKSSDLGAIHARMREAVQTIKTSRLGQLTGRSALYELPWYMVIGNPAAGKSTAVVQSGLKFPFADKSGTIIQGIGGTRNCDWFFTTEGILLDTAGRYSVHEEDRTEWLGFLSLLKKHRRKAPINGIVIAASVAELTGARPETAIQLAKSLRQRVQELTESLEIFAPVYVVFTKVDLIAGFQAFFDMYDEREREKVWGATLAYDPARKADAVELFDARFDELRDGLTETMMSSMAQHRGQRTPPGVLSFPLEFASIRPALRSFISTLFEDNPYQFRPIFRGFYFTSALQDGEVTSRVNRAMAEHFDLKKEGATETPLATAGKPYFLRDLFSKVVFADRNLVKQYTSLNKRRLRGVAFSGAALVLALALAGWGASYVGNRQLMAAVGADLDKAIKLQNDTVDLSARLEAMGVLQDRLRQLEKWRQDRPWSVSLGLYQGEAMERKLRAEYFHGVQQLMLGPVAHNLERYLADVNRNAARLQPMTKPPQSAIQAVSSGGVPTAPAADSSGFAQASATSVEDAYNALKTYLMLADRQYMESGHLADQISRFWRGWLESNRGSMPTERMVQSAERLVSFSLENLQAPDFPLIENNLGLVDQTRENLRRVVRGMPARERVYSGIKARAATRFAPVTVASLVGERSLETVRGSYAISGTFTKQAWTEYVEDAIRRAATEELQSVDWVLKTSARDDLSLEGSPDQVRKTLTELYKNEYVVEWQRFLQGVNVVDFENFDDAVRHMDQLGDASRSPAKQVMDALYEQTSWDNPSVLNEQLDRTQKGFMQWFKQTILRQAPSRVDVNLNLTAGKSEVPMGPIGREFAGLQRIMMTRDNSPTLMKGYLEAMGKLRSRFNQIKNQGDPGPAVKTLMSETFNEGNSELGAVLKYVDEQMLVGMPERARAAIRPVLVRPLVQAFSVMTRPVETELNRIWLAQVQEPFVRTLGGKYPFDSASKIEAAPSEIAKIFGSEGAVAQFGNQALAPLVVRRGDAVVARTWADVGVRLNDEFTRGFPAWIAPLEGASGAVGASTGGASAGAAASQTVFQIMPSGAPGLSEYSLEIDGQTLRYRNTAPTWNNFFWPNPAGTPGVRLTAVTVDGRSIELFNEPGRFGLERLFAAAKKAKKADGNELTWEKDGHAVTVSLRIVSQPGAAAPSTASAQGRGSAALVGLQLPTSVAGMAAPPATPTGPPASPTAASAPGTIKARP